MELTLYVEHACKMKLFTLLAVAEAQVPQSPAHRQAGRWISSWLVPLFFSICLVSWSYLCSLRHLYNLRVVDFPPDSFIFISFGQSYFQTLMTEFWFLRHCSRILCCVCIHIYIHVHVCASMHVCMCIFLHIGNGHTYMYNI